MMKTEPSREKAAPDRRNQNWFSRLFVRVERLAESIGLSGDVFRRDISASERDLCRYFDGELSDKQAEKFRAKTISRRDSIEQSTAGFNFLRKELRQWVAEGCSDSAGENTGGLRKVDLWAEISAEINNSSASRSREAVSHGLFSGLSDFVLSTKTVTMPQFATGFAAMLLLGVFAGWQFRGIQDGASTVLAGQFSPTEPAIQLAAVVESSEQQLAREQEELRNRQEIFRRSVGAPPLSSVASSEVLTSGGEINSSRLIQVSNNGEKRIDSLQRQPVGNNLSGNSMGNLYGQMRLTSRAESQMPAFERNVSLHINTSQLISQPFVPDGLRTDGMNIEWIRTDRPFRIVPANGRKAPPVIWVSR